MKIISKRARDAEGTGPKIPGLEVIEVYETTVVITSSGGSVMSPDDIKRAEEVFRELRRQLEQFGTI